MPLIVKKSKAFSPLAYRLPMRFGQRIRAECPNRQNEKENENWPARFLGLSKSQLVMVELSNTDFVPHPYYGAVRRRAAPFFCAHNETLLFISCISLSAGGANSAPKVWPNRGGIFYSMLTEADIIVQFGRSGS